MTIIQLVLFLRRPHDTALLCVSSFFVRLVARCESCTSCCALTNVYSPALTSCVLGTLRIRHAYMHILYFFLPYVFVLERSAYGTRYLASIERKSWEFAWESGSDGSVVHLFMLAFFVK